MSYDQSTSSDEPMEDVTGHTATPRAGQPFPAIAGRQGKRLDTFSTQIRPHDIETVLGHDPRSRNHKLLRDARLAALYDHVQRKTSEDRVRDIIAYYENRIFRSHPIAGAIPAISIAVERPVQFDKFGSHPSLGQMFLETGRHNRRVILDGLGRATGFLDLVDIWSGDKIDEPGRELLGRHLAGCSIPVVFYAPQEGQQPLQQEEMEQIFCDFNFRVRPVSIKDAIALDHSDPYVELTRYMAEHSAAIKNHGGMEEKRASLGSKSTAIVVQPVLLRFVRGALEGESYLEAARNQAVDKPNLTADRSSELRSNLADFLDEFATAMADRWDDKASMHLSSPGWQVIAVLYHDLAFKLGKSSADIRKFAGALARLDWSREGDIFRPFMSTKTKDGDETLVLNSAGASVRRELLKALRDKLGLTELLAERG